MLTQIPHNSLMGDMYPYSLNYYDQYYPYHMLVLGTPSICITAFVSYVVPLNIL